MIEWRQNQDLRGGLEDHERRLVVLENDLVVLDRNVNMLTESLMKINNTILQANSYLKGILVVIPVFTFLLPALISVGWLNIPHS